MLNLNVFNWPYSKKYYLTHPWKWVKEFFQNCYHGWRRAIYGWTWEDCWNLDIYLLNILPALFRHMADHGNAYPGVVPFEEPEKWHNWLHSIADTLELLQEENWYSQNEYEKDFHEMAAIARQVEQKQPNLNLTVTYNFNEQDMKNLAQLYFQRSKELTKEREKRLAEVGSEIFKYFTMLWD